MIAIKALRESKGISQKKLASTIGVSRSTIAMWETGKSQPDNDNLKTLASYFNVSVDTILGYASPEKDFPAETNAFITLDNKKIRLIPLFENVSAGFGATAMNEIVDYVPCYIENDADANDTLCIRVKGDSMFPKIEEGDIIQVQKQTSVDSGSIAVVLLDRTEGLVKRVIYGPDWIELHSINPMYPVQRFEGADIQRLMVVGQVKKIIKNV